MIRSRQRDERAAQQIAFDVEQRHAPAVGQKPFCHRKPDAARSTGDQRDLLSSIDHSTRPVVGWIL